MLTLRLYVYTLWMIFGRKLLKLERLAVGVHVSDDMGVLVSFKPSITLVKLNWSLASEHLLESVVVDICRIDPGPATFTSRRGTIGCYLFLYHLHEQAELRINVICSIMRNSI
jgi:hypothetical protein